jgi:hypothetical protein
MTDLNTTIDRASRIAHAVGTFLKRLLRALVAEIRTPLSVTVATAGEPARRGAATKRAMAHT